MSSKQEESKLNKLKQFLGIGGSKGASLQVGNVRQPAFELLITPELIQELSPGTPVNHRIKTLKDLCDVVLTRRLEENAVEILWLSIEDLLQPPTSTEDRQLTLRFLQCLIKGQYEQLGMMRAHFFRVIKEHKVYEDLSYRLDMFRALSLDGKDLEYFEEETGDFILEMMKGFVSSNKKADFLQLLVNLIKFNAAYLDEDIVAGLVRNTCLIAIRATTEADVQICLLVLDTVVCYTYLPSSCLLQVIVCLCRIVNIEKLCQQTWMLLRKLLGTHLGHSAVHTMCSILQDKGNTSESGAVLLRGAVFFIGMALWSSKRVPSLKHPPSAVLPSFLQALLSSRSHIVAYEVTLSVQRLITKYGKEQQHVTWDIILEIADALLKHVEESANPSPALISNIHDMLTGIETLYQHGQFCCSADALFNIIESCANKRPESSILVLVEHKAQAIHPTVKDNWKLSLNYLMVKYYKQEVRTKIRIKVLDVLHHIISTSRYVYEDDLIELVVLPQLSHLDQETDLEVKRCAVNLITELAMSCQSSRGLDLIDLIGKIISRPLAPAPPLSPTQTSGLGLPSSGDRQKVLDQDVAELMIGVGALLQIIKSKLYQMPSSHCVEVFELVTSHVAAQYSHSALSLHAAPVRKMIFEFLMELRADSLYRLGLVDKKGDHYCYSAYITCSNRDQFESSMGDSEAASPLGRSQSPTQTAPASTSASSGSTVLPYSKAFTAIRLCVEQEGDYEVLSLVLGKMPQLLHNKTLVLSAHTADLEAICTRLCAMVSERSCSVPEKLLNTPPKMSKSDFHCDIFPVLTCLVTYHTLLDKEKQRELLRCLEFGLVSKCARICVRALTVCALEMQEVMVSQLSHVLLNLSKICATKQLAIPLMEFLSSLTLFPPLYCNFVEREYLSIFAIALSYTNPFKFSHYVVCLAHHVISLWFVKCRLSFRKNFAAFLIKGLQANVLRQFEETALEHCMQNQDSADRSRTQSLNEAALISRGRAAAASARAKRIEEQERDHAMSAFHRELTETCIDMMARYTYSNCTRMPIRSPVAEFLLKGGQVQTWLLGNKIITITTSGGSKVTKAGLCENCISVARAAAEKVSEEARASTDLPQAETSGRRRHKSAAVRTVTEMVAPLKSVSQDDLVLHRQSSKDECEESGPQRAHSRELLASLSTADKPEASLETKMEKMQAVDSVLMGLKAKPSDKSIFSPAMCNCWCTQWAEVHVRRPTCNLSWMVRIQNEQELTEVFPDFPLADISNLLLPEKPEFSECVADMKIDSSHIEEKEYESLLQEHFGGTAGGADGWDVSTARPKEEATIRKIKSSPELQGHADSQQASTADPSLEPTDPFDGSSQPPPAAPCSAAEVRGDASCSSGGQARDSPCRDRQARGSTSSGITSIPEENGADSHGKLGAAGTAAPPPAAASTTPRSPDKARDAIQKAEPAGINSSSSSTNTPDKSKDHLPKDTEISKTSTPEKARDLMQKAGAAGGIVSQHPVVQGGVSPSFLFLQWYHANFPPAGHERPLLLPNTQIVNRAVKLLDLIFSYETHKIGVIYVGPGQAAQEAAILSSQYGCTRYMEFLQGLGQLIQLDQCNPDTTYMGGLDLSGSDGPFAYAWHDHFIQVIFHVATLMPNKESDPNCNAKKLHIGNDYVTIVYNDSEEEYHIGTIKGQFNYVNVVIQPLDHATNAVTVQTRNDVEDILEHTDTKIISDANLAVLVRQMALHANLASTILQKQKSNCSDLYASNWLERLRQIKRVRSKVLQETGTEPATKASPRHHAANQRSADDFTDFV